MNLEKFEELLKLNEKNFIDFKREMYFTDIKKDKDKSRAEFVKDIVSMWNTPRETDAYIVVGIKNYNNENKLVGVDKNDIRDDADLRGKFEGLVSYIPSFDYDTTIEFEGKNFIVITIPVATRISIVIKKFCGETLKKDVLYYREGSKNTEALTGSVKEREIYAWFRNKDTIIGSESNSYPPNDNLLSAMEHFDSDKYFYFLITSPINSTNSNLNNFGLVNWTFVMDFDPDGQNSGILSHCKDTLEKNRSLHLVVKGESPSIHSTYGTYWYFASGLSGRNETLLPDKTKTTWLKNYKRDFEKQIDNLLKSLGNKKPIKILVLIENNSISDYLRVIFDSLISTFQDSLSFLIVSPEKYSSLETIAPDYSIDYIQMPLLHLCQVFENCQHDLLNLQNNGYFIPSSSGTQISIEDKKIPWLKEELEIVHLGVGTTTPVQDISNKEFLRGHEISWENLKYQHDAERDETKKLEDLVLEGLKNRKHLRINLYHIPGAGGTTVARRILWNRHKQYPCVVLQSMKDPLETMARLSYLYEISQSSMVLLIDGGLISDRQSEALYEKIASSHLPVIMLQVLRNFDLPSPNSSQKNTRLLYDKLSKDEKDNFYHILSKEISKDKINELNQELKNNCTPFSLGFITFEKEYIGINNYIKYRLENISKAHKQIIKFLSIAYYYGQRGISPQWFFDILDIPANRYIEPEKVFNNSRIVDLIVCDELKRWRINHFIFAEKCLSYLLAPHEFGKNNEHIWKQNLSDIAKEFISFCRGNINTSPSDESLEIMYRVFYFRDNSELLGTEKSSFSKFIEDIENGKLEVFRYLTEIFPDQSQFWAHLGRFYKIIKHDADKALGAIDHALSLNDNDNLIYHMKGMAIGQKISNLIHDDKTKDKSILYQIISESEKASHCFSKCRELNPVDEFGYISEVQMIIKVLNYAGKYYNNRPIDAITSLDCPNWLRESLENASYLLAQVRRIRQETQRNKLEISCQAELDVINQDIAIALQKWNNLLERNQISPLDKVSIRRSIVYTRLKQAKHKWNDLNDKHIDRIVELLEENLKQGNSDKDLRLWINAIRVCSSPPYLERITEKISYWKNNTNSLDSVYYLYILQVLQVLSGSQTDFVKAEANIKECHDRSRYIKNNTLSFEWLGNGDGIKQLIHQEFLGEWDKNNTFWSKTNVLKRVNGVISSIEGPAKGYIEVEGTGLKAFFVPGKDYQKGSFESKNVTCYLGFSYSGLRAWEVTS